jgi:hypothetical protein
MSYRLLNVSLITAVAVLVTQSYTPVEAAKNLNTSRSNIYRMGGGGGGKGAVRLNPQPEPPGRR